MGEVCRNVRKQPMIYLFKKSLSCCQPRRLLVNQRLESMKRMKNSKARGVLMKLDGLNCGGKTQKSNNARNKPLAQRPCGLVEVKKGERTG